MNIAPIANSSILWFLCSAVIITVIIQTLIFMRKGWKEAISLGVSKEQLIKTVKASISVSILPTIPIILILLMMLPILGIPIPWLRLTIIGSAGYEFMAASMGIQSLGEEFGVGGFSKEAFGAAIWVMTIGGSAATFTTLVILKPITAAYEKFKQSGAQIASIFGLCCLTGVLGAVTADYGTRSKSGTIVLISSAICAFIIITVSDKIPKLKWLKDFNMALSMIFGMFIAVIIS